MPSKRKIKAQVAKKARKQRMNEPGKKSKYALKVAKRKREQDK